MIVAGILIGAVLVVCMLLYRHQSLLRDRAQLMRDAIRHRDFSFRLSTRGLLFGERALQEALNDMGQEIQKLVAHQEVESWQRLTRVLTHEIMNATTPIQSITQAYLSTPNIQGSPYEEGIQAIHDTSVSLANFVSNYRKLTQLQAPVMQEIALANFCRGISSVYPQLAWHIDIPDTISMQADESLLRQVFVNLVKNAIEAEARSMDIRYVAPVNRTLVERSDWRGSLLISNDGHLIPDDVAREIFVPFFTTKTTGSGIGLSLSRQLLVMMHLSLALRPTPIRGCNVTFVLESDR